MIDSHPCLLVNRSRTVEHRNVVGWWCSAHSSWANGPDMCDAHGCPAEDDGDADDE